VTSRSPFHDAHLSRIWKAVREGHVANVRRELAKQPTLFQSFPAESADILALAIQSIGAHARVTLLTPFDEAGEKLSAHRDLFDVLVDAGAAVNSASDSPRIPPLHAAAQLPHPLFVRELLLRGADRDRAVHGITAADLVRRRRSGATEPEDLMRDDAFLELLASAQD
jgi:hypothetical protein